MIHVLLLILKIILFVILGLLGLALFLILLILFSPIKYKLHVIKDENIKVDGKIKFLVVAIKVYFDKKENKLDIIPSVLGININKFRNKKNKSNSKYNEIENDIYEKDKLDEYFESLDDTELDDSSFDNYTENDSEIALKPELVNQPEENVILDKIENNTHDNVNTKEKKGLLSKLKNKISSIINKIKKISPEKISNSIEKKSSIIERKINLIKKFWNFDCTVKTRKYLKKYIISILKHILPRKISGYVRYGFGDPCKTGQVTGYLSLLPCVYQKDFSLQPDFYEKILECNVNAKGRIVLGYIVRIALKLYIWKTLKAYKKLSLRLKSVK